MQDDYSHEQERKKSGDSVRKRLIEFQSSTNIAELLDEDTLRRVGQRALSGYDYDKNSRADWEYIIEKAKEIAKQLFTQKDWPWPKSANVKYPAITVACIQYNARTYPQIIQNDKVVKTKYVGLDPSGNKYKSAGRVSMHMSYQLTEPESNWEEDTDNLLMMLPLYGIMFRKSFWDPINNRYCAELCMPDTIVVDYNCKSEATLRRISHVFSLTPNEIEERKRAELYLNQVYVDSGSIENMPTEVTVDDSDAPRYFVEQHCWADLDEDGFEEPYIITFQIPDGKIARIVARFDVIDGVKFNRKDQVVKIKARNFFTTYRFLPAPDGSFYGMGFGHLLYPLNEAINTVINSLLDAGTLSNLQSGFIGKGFNMGKGEIRFKPGEWKAVDAFGGDITKSIVPLPVREPSNVLLQLLGTLIQSTKELSSVTDMLMGQQQAQNVPATTAVSLIKQGLVVFNGIQKRIYRSLAKEFQKQFDINKEYLDDEIEFITLQEQGQVSREDYQDPALLVFPVADPNVSTDTERDAQLNALMQIAGDPNVNKREIIIRYIEQLKVPEPEKLLLPEPPPDAPPPPEVQKIMAEVDLLKGQLAKILMDADLNAIQTQINADAEYRQSAEGNSRVDKNHAESVAKLAAVAQKDHHHALDHALNTVQLMQSQTEMSGEDIKPKDIDVKAELAEAKQETQGAQGQPPGMPQPPPGAAPQISPQEQGDLPG